MTKMLMVEDQTANLLIATGLTIGTPFFLIFGYLSDKIGRKKIILTGCIGNSKIVQKADVHI